MTTRERSVASREFDLTYSVSLPNPPKSNSSLRIWIPVATTAPHQIVKLTQMAGTVPLRITRESEYGDHMAYAEIHHPDFRAMNFTLT